MTDNKTGSVNSLNSVNIPSKIVNQHFVNIDFHKKSNFLKLCSTSINILKGLRKRPVFFLKIRQKLVCRIYFDIRSCKVRQWNRNKFGRRTFGKNFLKIVLQADS